MKFLNYVTMNQKKKKKLINSVTSADFQARKEGKNRTIKQAME